jgi:hypothetical protein
VKLAVETMGNDGPGPSGETGPRLVAVRGLRHDRLTALLFRASVRWGAPRFFPPAPRDFLLF